MDTKNIPVSIHVQYIFFTNIYLSYLINNSLLTLPLTVNLLAVHVNLSESRCPLATCA